MRLGWLVLALALLSQAAAAEPRNVLLIASRDSQQPSYEEFMRGFRAVASAQGGMELFIEFLDSVRFPQPEHRLRMLKLLQEKYRAAQIDLVISTSPGALDFVLEHRAVFFPKSPMLYALVAASELPSRPMPDNAVGILDRFDALRTMELAQRLQPKARRVVVVNGSDAFDKLWEGIARGELQPKLSGLEWTYLSGLPLPRLLQEVAVLPHDTIVLFLSVARDGAGQTFRSPEVAQKVAVAASAPTYVPFPNHFGKGQVGGYLNSFDAVGRQAAAVAGRLLAGEPPARLRAEQPGPQGAYVVDWREMERWGLREARLPEGTVVRFREPSLWREYRGYVLAASLVIALQFALILALVFQRRARVSAEREVQDRRAELAQASRLALAGELSASIAHEINQPLGAILANAGAAEALVRRHPEVNEELRPILADIRAANVRASEIIRRVRALVTARQAEREPVEVNGMVRDVLALLRGEAARREVAVEVTLEPGMPPLLADRVQLQQALVNLCVNAMEAMAESPSGARSLSLRTAAGEDGGVEISISDTGPGIAAENLPKIFDSFFTTKAQGTGLGLAITRSIVEAHDGKVYAENLKQGGARFRMLLPSGAAA